MTTQTNKKTVFVGLSGGVDSSVSALRLLREGYNVVGVFIKVWHPDFLKCNWEEERLDAMRVAAHLGIPFLTCDAEEEYKKGVGEYFVNEYLAGRTPNPDVMCNREVKFGAFWRFARTHGADFIATGHYGQVVKSLDSEDYSLLRGHDKNKDQTYFLWTLTQDDLKHTLFPVGNSNKEDIRAEAAAAKLPTAIKKDSQGICFLGHVDIPEFLSHFTDLKEGKVLDIHGEHVGTHKGALIYTLGQRHGFTIHSNDVTRQPHYIVAKDLDINTLVVDTTPPTSSKDSHFALSNINWIVDENMEGEFQAVTRYRQKPFIVKLTKKENQITVWPAGEIEKPSAGQSCVIYLDDRCLGGGVIE